MLVRLHFLVLLALIVGCQTKGNPNNDEPKTHHSGADQDFLDNIFPHREELPGVISPLLPDRTQCGRQEGDRIIGGKRTEWWEHPWMVLLRYRKKKDNKLTFACGGALINNRYVVTAAHCVTGDITTQATLVHAVLGLWDKSSVDEQSCYEKHGIEECNDVPVVMDVEYAIPHPQYDDKSLSAHNDIALIRLTATTNFTMYIRPICLPLPSEVPAPGKKLTVCGWGETEYAPSSRIKLKVDVPVVKKRDCQYEFEPMGVTIKDTQLCAGGERGKDSCGGDSGGPLLQKPKEEGDTWILQGVVSFGGEQCGKQGNPAVYTRVIDYVDWILNNIKP